MLVGADDRGRYLRPLEQLDVALRDEIGADFRAYFARTVRILLGKANPFDRRMARGHLAAEKPHAAAADDRKADAFGGLLHWFTPARIFCLNSAMAEMVSFVSGKSTGSLRSADKSAAL